MLRLLLLGCLVGLVSGQANGTRGGDDKCISELEWVKRLTADGSISQHGGVPVTAKVNFWIQNLGPLSKGGSLFTTFYLDLQWMDKRTSFTPSDICGSPERMTIRGDAMTQIWRPDVGLIRATEGSVVHSPLKNDFLLIYSNGTVWGNARIAARIPCELDWAAFPRDTVTCTIMPQSLSYPKPDLDFVLGSSSVLLLQNFSIPQFVLGAVETSRIETQYPAGLWVEILLTFRLTRRTGYFYTQLYIPSVMTLIIALLSFLLSPTAITARLLLCLQALFFLLALGAHARTSLPQVSNITHIDQWLGVSFAVAFLAILLNIVSNRLSAFACARSCRGKRSYSINGNVNGDAHKILGDSEDTDMDMQTYPPRSRLCGCLASTVDAVGLLALPVLFAVFSAYYFNAF